MFLKFLVFSYFDWHISGKNWKNLYFFGVKFVLKQGINRKNICLAVFILDIKKWLPVATTDLQNRGFTRYALKCLGIIYIAARAAALQSIFEICGRSLPPFFYNAYRYLRGIYFSYGFNHMGSMFYKIYDT